MTLDPLPIDAPVWFIAGPDATPIGPLTHTDLRVRANARVVRHDTLVWRRGWPEWRAAGTLPELGLPGPHSVRSPSPFAIAPMRLSAYDPRSLSALHAWSMALAAVGGMLLCSMIAMFVVAAFRVASHERANPGVPLDATTTGLFILGGLVMAIGVLISFASAAVWGVCHYRWWRQIQDGFARTGPGRAVGLLFVPFFQLYWCFIAIRGLAMDLGSFMDRNSIDGPRPSVPLATATCVLLCLVNVPYLGVLAFPPALVVTMLFSTQTSRASVRVAEHLRSGRTP